VRPIHNDPRTKRATFPESLPLFVRVGEHEEAAMHFTKLRFADNDGLIPAGAYFARLADTLRTANARGADAEERERKLAARHRRPRSVPTPRDGELTARM
jgi:hypothetical protein